MSRKTDIMVGGAGAYLLGRGVEEIIRNRRIIAGKLGLVLGVLYASHAWERFIAAFPVIPWGNGTFVLAEQTRDVQVAVIVGLAAAALYALWLVYSKVCKGSILLFGVLLAMTYVLGTAG